MGLAIAKELIFTARIIDGIEASRIGLVNHAVDGDDEAAYEKALEIAAEIISKVIFSRYPFFLFIAGLFAQTPFSFLTIGIEGMRNIMHHFHYEICAPITRLQCMTPADLIPISDKSRSLSSRSLYVRSEKSQTIFYLVQLVGYGIWGGNIPRFRWRSARRSKPLTL